MNRYKKEELSSVKLRNFVGTLAICLSLAMNGIALGADPMPPPDEEKRVGLAAALVEYGKEAHDALALLAAAKIYRSVSARVLKKGQSGKAGMAVDPDELFESARKFANNNEHLLGLIDQEKRSKSGAKQVYYSTCYYEWFCTYSWYCYYKWVCY